MQSGTDQWTRLVMDPILLTGATGYIGGRLLRSLEGAAWAVRCLARRPGRVASTRSTTEVDTGDCLDKALTKGALSRALKTSLPQETREALAGSLTNTEDIEGGARGQE